MSASDHLSKQFNKKWPIQVSVPTKFLKDHLSRCDDCGNDPIKVIKPGAKLTKVELHERHHKDLMSDANYYDDDFDKEDESSAYALAPSARATKARLAKALEE